MQIYGYVKRILYAVCVVCVSGLASAEQQEKNYQSAVRYNIAGQVLGEISIDPDGVTGVRKRNATRYTYDGVGRLRTVEQGVLNRWADETVLPKDWDFTALVATGYQYNAYGQKAAVTTYDANNYVVGLVQYSYDSDGRVLCKAVRMNKTYFDEVLQLDACELGVEGDDGKDRITRYEYNKYDQVTIEWRAWGTTLQQKYVERTYDYMLPKTLKDANENLTTLEYDDYGRIEKRYYPSKTKGANSHNNADYSQFSYDINGDLEWERKRSGAVFNYSYDAFGRVVKKWQSGSSANTHVHYVYDLRGIETDAVFESIDGSGIRRVLDGFGRVQSVTTTTGGMDRVLTYHYDEHANRTRLYHADNKYFSYRFDHLNRVTGVGESSSTTNVQTLAYQDNGKRDYISRYGGSRTYYRFDDAQRLKELEQNFTGTVNDLKNNFSYNPANQISTLDYTNDKYMYEGNQNETGVYVSNGLNQYTSVDGKGAFYDGNANLKSFDGTTYTYDAENRLVTISGGTKATLKYDPNGRLYETIINGSKRQYLYDGDALIAEYTSSTAVAPVRRYLHGDQVDEPWVQYNGSNVGANYRRYLHADQLGSIIAHSNRYNTVLNTLSYDTYGIPGDENIDRFGYTGQLWFKELGLYSYKARFYHPRLGRFLQTDPIGYEDQMNLYAYVHNDPMTYVDPSGKTTVAAGAIGGTFVCGPICGVVGAVGAGILTAIVANEVYNESSEGTRELGDLEPIHDPDHAQNDPAIGELSDEELGEAINNPEGGDKVTVRGNKVLDGNTRINEAKGRGWADDTQIPVDELPELPDNIDDNPLGPYGG